MKRLLLLLPLILLACDRGEIPVTRHPAGDVLEAQVSISPDYRYQVFYDLETNSMVGQRIKTDWDLGFQSGSNEWQITLNGARFMAVWNTGEPDFTQVSDSTGADWKYDNVRGNLDSTAFGDWRITHPVYVVNMGYDHLGHHMGMYKIQIQDVTNTHYSFRASKLDGTEDATYTINKDETFNRNCFSLKNGMPVVFEPAKTDWDLVFTQYTHVYHDGVRYLVTGVLTNPFKTTVAWKPNTPFASITLDQVPALNFESYTNQIGFDWKEYNFGTGKYEVDANRIYVIKTSDDHIFKLHFVDFYDNSGNKGNPVFEHQLL